MEDNREPRPDDEAGEDSARQRDEPPSARRLLDAAQRLLERDGGLGVTLERLSFDAVVKEAGVSRSSAYRIWDTKDAFYVDLLCDLAGPSWQGTAAFDEETIKLVRDLVAERLGELDRPEGRRDVLREAIRRGANQNFQAITQAPQWRTYVALTAMAMSFTKEESDTGARIQRALQEAERTFIGRMSDFYADMAVLLGLRLKPHVPSFDLLTAAGASVVEGLGLRRQLMPEFVDVHLTLEGPSGPEEWSLAALGFWGIFDQFIEPDPDYRFTEAIALYLKRLAERERNLTPRGPGQ